MDGRMRASEDLWCAAVLWSLDARVLRRLKTGFTPRIGTILLSGLSSLACHLAAWTDLPAYQMSSGGGESSRITPLLHYPPYRHSMMSPTSFPSPLSPVHCVPPPTPPLPTSQELRTFKASKWGKILR